MNEKELKKRGKASRKKMVALDQIRIDGGTQVRFKSNDKVVAEYAERMFDGVEFVPIVLFFDGEDHWLADGFHRYMACKKLGRKKIKAEVREGLLRDAKLYSFEANVSHGLRLTSAEKRNAVFEMLKDEEWGHWSNREIARRCGVHHQLVGRCRAELDDSSSEKPQSRTYKTKHGTVAKMRIANNSSSKRDFGSSGESRPSHRPMRDLPAVLLETPIKLSHDPEWGSRAILTSMGKEYCMQMMISMKAVLKEKHLGAK